MRDHMPPFTLLISPPVYRVQRVSCDTENDYRNAFVDVHKKLLILRKYLKNKFKINNLIN